MKEAWRASKSFSRSSKARQPRNRERGKRELADEKKKGKGNGQTKAEGRRIGNEGWGLKEGE